MADPARFEKTFTITTSERGKITLKVVDRINIDDVFMYLIDQELYSVMTGKDPSITVPDDWVDTLVTTQYSAR